MNDGFCEQFIVQAKDLSWNPLLSRINVTITVYPGAVVDGRLGFNQDTY
jgi:hypothetical protein